MNWLKQSWVKVSLAFDDLPKPVKAAFFMALNVTFTLMSKDVLKLDNGNPYVAIWLGLAANVFTYIALYFGAKAGTTE